MEDKLRKLELELIVLLQRLRNQKAQLETAKANNKELIELVEKLVDDA